MGVIGRTLAFVGTASAVSYGPCLPDDVRLPQGYKCGGVANQFIVDDNNVNYCIEGEQLVLCSNDVDLCPAVNDLPLLNGVVEYVCTFQSLGYIEQLSTGFLMEVDGRTLVFLTANGQAPNGFSFRNDGSGLLDGPDGGSYSALGSDGYKIKATTTVITDTEDYFCPLSILPPTYSCDDDAQGYIIGPNDSYFVRTSESEIAPLTVSGTTAPSGFTWTVPYTTLQGPRGMTWRVDTSGGLTKSNGSVGVALECNGGLPLPQGYKCAGNGFGYVLDGDDEYYFINANNALERLAINEAGEAPAGFTILDGRKTMSDPDGRVYGFDASRRLVLASPADVIKKTCRQSTLPPTYRCANAKTDYLGNSDGLFGYVVHEEDNENNDAVFNYYVIVTDGTGTERLRRLATSGGAIPAGFTTLPTSGTSSASIRLEGPDQVISDQDIFFKINANGELAGVNDYEAPDPADVVDCPTIEDRFDTGFSCASQGGELFNYVIGPGFNFYKIASETQLDRLRVVNNVAPAGFSQLTDGTLESPEANGYVYRVAEDGKLVAENPNAAELQLGAIACPENQLPEHFSCPSQGTEYGYVLGQNPAYENCPRKSDGSVNTECEWEYFIVDASTSPARLVRLKVTNNEPPPGFTLLPGDSTRLKGPAGLDRVYSVDPVSGVLVSEEAPEEEPTIGNLCVDAVNGWGNQGLDSVLPVGFRCVNTEASPEDFCGWNSFRNLGAAGLTDVDFSDACDAFNFKEALFRELEEEEQDECQLQCMKHVRGFGYGPAQVTGDITLGDQQFEFGGETYRVEFAHGYMLDTETFNYFTTDGVYIVRLSTSNNEPPEGFTLTADNQRLRGPDAESDALGWEYEVLSDGTLVATGGKVPEATVYTEVCPAERLGSGFSCVEDYESDYHFDFYIRDDRTDPITSQPARNLFVVNPDGATMGQLTISSNLEVAPAGFSYLVNNDFSAVTTTDGTATDLITLQGPLGFRYYVAKNRKVYYDQGVGVNDNVLAPVDTGDNVVAAPGVDPVTGATALEQGWIEDSTATLPTVMKPLGCVSQLGATFTVTYVLQNTKGSANKFTFRIKDPINFPQSTPVATDGTSNKPHVPCGWPEERNQRGFFVDPNGNEYYFVYADYAIGTAHVVYLLP